MNYQTQLLQKAIEEKLKELWQRDTVKRPWQKHRSYDFIDEINEPMKKGSV